MIIVLKKEATQEQKERILQKAKELNLNTNVSEGVERTIIGFIGDEDALRAIPLEAFPAFCLSS